MATAQRRVVEVSYEADMFHCSNGDCSNVLTPPVFKVR